MPLSRVRERMVGRLRSRRTRVRERLYLAEGVRLCEEALDAGAPIRFAVVSPALQAGERGRALRERLLSEGVEVHTVSDPELEALSDTETPQGVLLVCEEPDVPLDHVAGWERVLVLDGVQDPGNLGTLVRAASAFAVDGVLALDGTVDPWNPKAVRATAGAGFRVPVGQADWREAAGVLEARGRRLWVADAAGVDVATVTPGPPWAVFVGNEGSGCRESVKDAARELVAVPMPGGAESLNAGVAGAILLYALTREREGG